MIILITAVVSALVSAVVSYAYDRLTSERRVAEALAKIEVDHDREMVLGLGRSLRKHKQTYWSSDRGATAQEAFAVNLGAEFGPLSWELSNRMIRRMLELDIWHQVNYVAFEWVDAGASWAGDDPWFKAFCEDVGRVEDGLETLIGGDADSQVR